MERLGAKTRFQAGLMLGQMNSDGAHTHSQATHSEIPASRQP
jgi:hypothetical protein